MNKLTLTTILSSTLLFSNVGIVKNLSGQVEIKRNKQILTVKVGSPLENGDIIKTKSKSSVGITFDDGTQVALGERAIFVIKHFVVKPEKKEFNVDLELKKGKAIFTSGKIGKLNPEAVKFSIPEGAVGIRGTKFAIEVK